jgi:hypothetical protein
MDNTEREHDATCEGCEHDCPWRRHHWGSVYCQTCDDHAEAMPDADAS